MSSWGRCQDALHNLYEIGHAFKDSEPGIVQELGITHEQWSKLITPIIEAVYPIAFEQGRRQERHESSAPVAVLPEGDDQ